MRQKLFYSLRRGLIRMSWHPVNLFNLAARQRPEDITRKTVFQQRWIAKREIRAYFGAQMTEKQFRHTWLSEPLPVYISDMSKVEQGLGGIDEAEPNFPTAETADTVEDGNASVLPLHVARPVEAPWTEVPIPPPMQCLSVAPFERRVDTILFRACFVPCIFTARRLVVAGKVNVNGVECREPSFLVADSDIVSVDPASLEVLGGPRFISLDPPEEKGNEEIDDAADGDGGNGNQKKTCINGEDVSTEARELNFTPKPWQQPWMFIPEYLEVDFSICSVVFLRAPKIKPGECEIPSPFPPDMFVNFHEYYTLATKGVRVRLRRERPDKEY